MAATQKLVAEAEQRAKNADTRAKEIDTAAELRRKDSEAESNEIIDKAKSFADRAVTDAKSEAEQLCSRPRPTPRSPSRPPSARSATSPASATPSPASSPAARDALRPGRPGHLPGTEQKRSGGRREGRGDPGAVEKCRAGVEAGEAGRAEGRQRLEVRATRGRAR